MRASLLLALLVGCGPSLSSSTIANHPKIALTILAPQTIEASEPVEPTWVRTPHSRGVDAIAFTGQSFARTLEVAKAEATRDMLAAVSSYVAVEVQAVKEVEESLSVVDGEEVDQRIEMRSTVRSSTAARLRGIAPQASYWEKVAASALTPEKVSFRYWVHARVPRAEITLARLNKQLAREKRTGQRMLVLLPFRAASPGEVPAGAEGLANAFVEELSRRLDASAGLYVVDPTLVRALVAADPGAGEAEIVESLREALLPDVIVGGSYQLHRGTLRVTYTLYGPQPRSRTLDRPYAELFALQDELEAALVADLDAPPRARTAPSAPPSLAAFELYHAAYGLYAAGKNHPAAEALSWALAEQPDYAAATLRLGRVLERLGRYGRVPAAAATERGEWFPVVCAVEWPEISEQHRRDFFTAREGAAPEGDRAWLEGAANVDHVLAAAAFVVDGGPVPRPEIAPLPKSAAGAYWRAFALADAQGRRALAAEAFLALADLAVRVDRLAAAEKLYAHLGARAEREADLSLQSFVAYGLGRVRVRQGRFAQARQALWRAREARWLLGEKPYLLEIENELGNVEVQRGDYPAALARYRAAQRLAEALDNDYFRAVLANNLGVLEYLRGNVAVADELFASAWDVLNQLAEAEGRINAGLNLGLVGGRSGDLERADAYLAEVRRILGATQQESALAALYDHEGQRAELSGRHVEALRRLLRAWALFDRLGRDSHALRLRNNVSVADFAAFTDAVAAQPDPPEDPHADTLRCLQAAFDRLMLWGYGVWLPTRDDRYGYLPGHRPHPGRWARGQVPEWSVSYLIARLNAAVITGVEP